MSTVTTRNLPNVATKFQAGVAAVAAVAILTPAVAAQADVAAPAPLAPVTHVLDGQFPQDTNFWWFGGANPNPPAPFLVLEFQALAFIPGFLEDAWKQWTANWNFQACFMGAGVKIGPYGSVKVTLSRGC